MYIPQEKLIFNPGLAMVGNTVFDNEGLEGAIMLSGMVEAAETAGTPLFDLVGRVYESDDKRGGNGDDIAEFAGRQCYRSWMKGRPNAEYIHNVMQMGHGSVFEHAALVFQVTGVSRSLTHELIRHRVGTAYSQESQRYVDAKDINFVVPPLLANAIEKKLGSRVEGSYYGEDQLNDIPGVALFRRSCQRAIDDYIEFQPVLKALCDEAHAVAKAGDVKVATSAQKRANEAARSLLPNATETRMLFTVNLRQMFHMLLLRGGEPADLEIRRFAVALLEASRSYAPNFFSHIETTFGADNLAVLMSETGAI